MKFASLLTVIFFADDSFWETNITPTEQETAQSEQDNLLKFISTARNSEITIIPKKRKIEDAEENETKNTKMKKCENCEDITRMDVFGQFVATQVQTITNKTLRLKLMHTIQNAIIDAQIKQIDEDEKK